ncbi:hypothetical protein [Paenibacillus harenae]|uniref:hypothetical protein n=1 Tax=Paenibacillus harenae TaxID=306543 RepID=UPI00278FABA0|nr:hypothetical protein [Paenibacillus harenae]MDQ0062333.1 hypothetical protein [Paenibacillus harenae]
MKVAYLSHNFTLMRIEHCQSEEGKKKLALNYFVHDGPLVNEQMKLTEKLIEQLEAQIEEMKKKLKEERGCTSKDND